MKETGKSAYESAYNDYNKQNNITNNIKPSSLAAQTTFKPSAPRSNNVKLKLLTL